MILSPFNIASTKSFYPYAKRPATCLTQYLPPKANANILLLSSGDPLDILYTIYLEHSSGRKRFLDITCCDEEPAIFARNILLFTILFDIDENTIDSADCYSLFYEFYIEKQTYNLIRDQAGKLIDLSRTIDIWNQGQYGQLLRFTNTTTLKAIQKCWTQYFNSESSNATQRTEFIRAAVEYTSLKDDELAVLTPTFGALALDSVIPAISLAKEFWKSAAMERQKEFVNPLFVYFSGSSHKSSIHPKAHPLSGFHLASSLVQLTKDSPYYQSTSPEDNEETVKKRIKELARLQFSIWCKSFQKHIRSSSSLKIRYCVSNAIVLCFALQQVLYPNRPNPLEFYFRTDAGLEFSLDGDQPSLPFNVVDTSELVDSVGLFNILVSVVPLLQQSIETTLYINKAYSCMDHTSETELLSSLLIEDVRIMCSIFGVIPWNYIRPYVSEGNQRNVTNANDYLNRIAWKVLLAGDPLIQPEQAKIVFEPTHLSDILFRIYQGLFLLDSSDVQSHQPTKGAPYHRSQCTINGFAMLLAFLKYHVIVDWRDMMAKFLKHLESEEKRLSVHHTRCPQLLVELHLFELWTEDPKISYGAESIRSSPRLGCAMRTLFPVNYFILTIPRHRLASFYQRFLEMGRHVFLRLEIALVMGKLKSCVFSPTSIIFGILILQNDGRDCIIEPDVLGWDGSSDLHVCAYIPGYILEGKHVSEDISIQCLISSDNSVQSLNDNTEITLFETSLFNNDSVHLFNQLPTSKDGEPSQLSHDTPAYSDADIQITYPKFNPVDASFLTQIIFPQSQNEQLIEDDKFKAWIRSLFTIDIAYNSVIHTITFPFPFAECTIRKHVGCVDLVVTMLSLDRHRNETFLPITPFSYDASENVFGHVFPIVQFELAPKLDRAKLIDSHNWIDKHLAGIFSNREYDLLEDKSLDVRISDPLIGFKSSVGQLLHRIATSEAHVFEIRAYENEAVALILFVSGLFLDQSTNSIMAEAYIPLASREHKSLIDDARKNSVIVCTSQESIKFWRNMIFGMCERCRDWEHDRDDCVINMGSIPENPEGDICLCGVGKVSNNLENEKWTKLTPILTRIAIGPLFSTSFVEKPRRWIDQESHRVMISEDTKHVDICNRRGCHKDGDKKCGRCGKVRYCSRECQVIDWKNMHKVECRKNDIQGNSK